MVEPLRGDGRVGRQEAERLSPSRKVVSDMAQTKPAKSNRYEPTAVDHVQTIIALCRSNMECADSLAAELEGIHDLAEELLGMLTK